MSSYNKAIGWVAGFGCLLALGMTGCAYEVEDVGRTESALRATVTTGPGYTRVDGEIRDAFYILVQPDVWNGDLVVLLRGGAGASAGEPVHPPEDMVPLAEALAANGFGVAMSSFRSNGFSVNDGLIDSKIAERQFQHHFGSPTDTFLWGFSMGTHILQHYMEGSPNQYAGGLAVCGSLGGPTLAWETFVHKRALFDYFYPGVLPGDALSTPTPTFEQFETEYIPAIIGAILANPFPAIEMTGVEQFQYQFTGDFFELINAVVLAVAVATLDGADLVDKAHGIPVDTTDVVYTGSFNDAALNAGIDRFAADRQAERYLHRTDPNGRRLSGPILELHNDVDPIVPVDLHREAYLDLLDDDTAELVLFREVDRFGHCELTPEELFGAFGDLVFWSKTGIRPGS